MSTEIKTEIQTVVRQAAWMASIASAQKQVRKGIHGIAPMFGISQEMLKSKTGKRVVGLLVPAVIYAALYFIPGIKPKAKKRIAGYMRQSMAAQLARLLGNEYGVMAGPTLAALMEGAALISADEGE